MYNIAAIKENSVVLTKSKDIEGLKIPKESFVWLDIRAKSEKDLAGFKKQFGIHKLAIEDCIDYKQRPKVEIFEDYILVIIKAIEFTTKVESHHLAVIIGKNYVATISNNGHALLKELQKRLANEKGKKFARGPDFLAYLILDKIVDSYFPVLDRIEDDIEAVEAKILTKTSQKTVNAIFKARRNLLLFRKSVWPTRDVFSVLCRGGTPNITDKTRVYYRDVYDHIVLSLDLIETYHEMANEAMEAYMSSISNAMNEVIKVLTVIASLMLVPMLITGIYGMNFKLLPASEWEYSFLFSIFLILFTIVAMWIWFRRKGWV